MREAGIKRRTKRRVTDKKRRCKNTSGKTGLNRLGRGNCRGLKEGHKMRACKITKFKTLFHRNALKNSSTKMLSDSKIRGRGAPSIY